MTETSALPGRTPLDGVTGPLGGPSTAGVVLSERRHLGKLILRGSVDEKAFMDGASKVLGAGLPSTPNTTAESGRATTIWTAPDEWLLITAPGDESALEADLAQALAGVHHAVTDVTDQSTVIRLSGADARTVMAKGCAIDLHASVFGPGQSAQSHLAAALVTFWQIGDTPDASPSYDIMVRASFAAYLWAWLSDAGLEFGVRTEA